jgi:stearoyl-CoA desaturase (delta-9 desaturase)
MAFLGLAKVKKVPPEPRFDLQKQVCDLTTLQSVVANRYDVMAKYARSFKRTWREEVGQLKQGARLEPEFLKSTKQLLQRAPDTLQLTQKQQLSELFQHSKALKTMHEMRTELAALWERSHQSSDQLVLQLRDWCARAEASGIRSLEEFSHRLRSYA